MHMHVIHTVCDVLTTLYQVPKTTTKVANPSTFTTEPATCGAVAEQHYACFTNMDIPYATCNAALHAHSSSQCCGHLFLKHIYVDCLH